MRLRTAKPRILGPRMTEITTWGSSEGQQTLKSIVAAKILVWKLMPGTGTGFTL
jgi:hypothetical protein